LGLSSQLIWQIVEKAAFLMGNTTGILTLTSIFVLDCVSKTLGCNINIHSTYFQVMPTVCPARHTHAQTALVSQHSGHIAGIKNRILHLGLV
jgi:hypothetical protein